MLVLIHFKKILYLCSYIIHNRSFSCKWWNNGCDSCPRILAVSLNVNPFLDVNIPQAKLLEFLVIRNCSKVTLYCYWQPSRQFVAISSMIEMKMLV